MRYAALLVLVTAVLVGAFVSWWAGLIVAAVLPLMPGIADTLTVARTQAALLHDYQYELGPNAPQYRTLRLMVRECADRGEKMSVDALAMLFMCVQVESLARLAATAGRDDKREMMEFVRKVRVNADRVASAKGPSTAATLVRVIQTCAAAEKALA